MNDTELIQEQSNYIWQSAMNQTLRSVRYRESVTSAEPRWKDEIMSEMAILKASSIELFRDEGDKIWAQIGIDPKFGMRGSGSTLPEALRRLAEHIEKSETAVWISRRAIQYVEDGVLKSQCPECGHIHEMPDMSEVFAYVCPECGSGVEAEPLPGDLSPSTTAMQSSQVLEVVPHSATGDMEEDLQKMYDSEINVDISWFWDSGIDVKLGDQMNGYDAEAELKTIAEIIPWLQAQIAKHYPLSTYHRSRTKNNGSFE